MTQVNGPKFDLTVHELYPIIQEIDKYNHKVEQGEIFIHRGIAMLEEAVREARAVRKALELFKWKLQGCVSENGEDEGNESADQLSSGS